MGFQEGNDALAQMYTGRHAKPGSCFLMPMLAGPPTARAQSHEAAPAHAMTSASPACEGRGLSLCLRSEDRT